MGLKVTITPATGVPVTLCDSPDPLPSFGFTINRKLVLRMQPLFRAEYQAVKDQKNKINRVSFSVTRNKDRTGREFGSHVAALAFAMDHPEELPGSGVVTFAISDGRSSATRSMEMAGIEVFELSSYRGPTLRLRYEIIGGKFS